MVMVKVRKRRSSFAPIEKKLVCFALWLTLVATAGCDASIPTSGSNASAPRGEARTEKLKTNLTAEELREIAQPAGATPGLSVDVQQAQNTGVGGENFNGELGAPKGLNTRLFGSATGSEDERFERLESAVQQLRDDFDNVAPAINRLIAIEREIQGLVDQLQVLVENDQGIAAAPIPPIDSTALEDPASEFPQEEAPAPGAPIPLAPPLSALPENPAPVQPLAQAPPPVPAPPPPTPAAVPPSAPAASGEGIAAIRIADHTGKTRIVFETNGNLPYTADVDPEKILIVTFAKGAPAASVASVKSALVKSVDQTPQSSGGVIVAMPLAKMSKIIGQGVLKPDAQNPRYRVYIDLQR